MDLIDKLSAETPPNSKTINDLISEALVQQGVEVPEPEVVFAIDGKIMFTKKSLSTIKAKAKVGKTTVTAWITANIINNGLSTLWIDTEQGLYYASRTQNWILRIAGKELSENIQMYDLKIHGPNKRVEIIEEILKHNNYDMIVIDGIRDLIYDINSPEESTNVLTHIMRWADKGDCHVMNIIHENKGNGGDARGHLGSELINKSETVIKLTKDDSGVIICEPEYTRSEAFGMFGIGRDEIGIPYHVTHIESVHIGESNSKKITPTDLDDKTHKEILVSSFGVDDTLSYGELLNALKAAFANYGSELGDTRAKTFISWYQQSGYVEKAERIGNKQFYKLTK